jgi:hypothetical protein
MFEVRCVVRCYPGFRLDLLGLRLPLPLQSRPAQIYVEIPDSTEYAFRLRPSGSCFEAHWQNFKVHV